MKAKEVAGKISDLYRGGLGIAISDVKVIDQIEALILADRKATVERCKRAVARIVNLDYTYGNICDALDAVLEEK